jgi:hypothetical protein
MTLAARLLPFLFVTGCLSHLPPRSTAHLQIHWAADFEAAQKEAQATGRPILACLVAGEIAGLC